MKKTLLSICFFIYTVSCFAQNVNSPISYGIKAGVNFSNLVQSSGGASTSALTSFNAGVFADFKFNNEFSLQPQLLYSGKGASNNLDESGAGFSDSYHVKLNLYYLHLPIYAVDHAPVGENDFIFGIGPFISYGVSGTENGSTSSSVQELNGGTTTETQNINENISFGSSDSTGVKRLDIGASVMAGFKFKSGFLISASYDLGFSNISPASDDDVKTRVFSVSVGYSF